MTSEQFYASLPVIREFSAVSDLANYSRLPDEWQIVVADVEDSTGAIRAGMYKAVNISGVSVITSVLNATRPLAIPYIFGGDGASLCIPACHADRIRTVLIATKAMADHNFGLRLRIGIVPVSVVTEANYRVLVARYRVSSHYVQAAFAGGGIEYAEALIKQKSGSPYRIEGTDQAAEADFSGLECRWDNVPSQHGEIIALMVKAITPSLEEQAQIYRGVINRIQTIYGEDESCRPVYLDGLQATYNVKKLGYETAVRTFTRGHMARFGYLAKILLQNIIGRLLMTLRLTINDVDWGKYKTDLIYNSDFKKFDGVLRAILSGTPQQREELAAWLNEQYEKKLCVYGIHTSQDALITCLISKRSGEHYHFIDGADGGYAMAATAMKQQLKQLQS